MGEKPVDEARRIPELPLSEDGSHIYYGDYDIDRTTLAKGSRQVFGRSKKDRALLERYNIDEEAEPLDAPPEQAALFRGLLRDRARMISGLVRRSHVETAGLPADNNEDKLTNDSDQDVPQARHPGSRAAADDAPRGRRGKHSRKERERLRQQRERERYPTPVPTAGLATPKEPESTKSEPSANDYLAEDEDKTEVDKYMQSFRLYGPMVTQLHKFTSFITSERIVHAVWMNYVCELSMPIVDRPVRAFHARICDIIEQPMFIDRVMPSSYNNGVLRLIARYQQYPQEERDRNLKLLLGKTFGDMINQNNFGTYIQDFLSVYFEFEFVTEAPTSEGQQCWKRVILPSQTDFNLCIPAPEKLFEIPSSAASVAQHRCRLVSARFVWYEIGM